MRARCASTTWANGGWKKAARRARQLGEPPGGARSGGMRRRYALDVVAQVHEGRLRVDWLYNAALQAADAMTALAEHFRAELDAVLAHCLSPQSGGLTPSDRRSPNWSRAISTRSSASIPGWRPCTA